MGRRREALIARRIHLDFTQESLAHRLNVATATVTKWEHGTRLPAPGIRRNLAQALEVSLIELDRLLGIELPISLDGHEVPTWLSHYDSLMLAAGRLAEAQRVYVPALLQTKAYASAIERYGPLQLSDEQVIERVDVRLARQSVLHRDPGPLELSALLVETVLHEVVGGPDVMVEQLDHLAEMVQRPNVEIRILPADGRAACALGGFQMLTRPGDVEPFMVVTLDVAGAWYHEGGRKIEPFIDTFRYLTGVALSPHETTRRLKTIRETYR